MVPDTHLLKLLFPTRYTSRSIYQSSMCDSQSASSCGLASWMRTQECDTSMIPDTHLLKLLFLTRYTSRSIRILYISTNIVLPTYFLYVPFYNMLHINAIFATHLLPFLFIKNSNILIQWTNIRTNQTSEKH